MIGYAYLACAGIFLLAAAIQTAAAYIGARASLLIPVPFQLLAAVANGYVAYLYLTAP